MNIFQFPKFGGKKKPNTAKQPAAVMPANVRFSDDEDEVFEPGPGRAFTIDDDAELSGQSAPHRPATVVAPQAKSKEKKVSKAVEYEGEDLFRVGGVWFVASVSALHRLLEKHKRPRIVLRGDLVLLSLNPSATPPGERYVKQLPRVASPSLSSLLKADADNAIVSVWLLKDAIDRLAANRVTSVALEIDQFMHFTGAKKGKKLLLTSWRQDGKTRPVSALAFKDGVVQHFVEKKCKERDFERDVRALLDQLRNDFPEYELAWADPVDVLPEFLPAGTQNVGAKPYQKLVTKPILGQGQKITFLQRYGLSLIIGCGATVAYAAMLAVPYQGYSDIRGQSQAILKSFNADKEFRTDQLGVLQARRFFISEPRAQAQQTDLLRKAIQAVGNLPQKAWIQDMKLTAAGAGKKGELKMTLRVVKDVESDGVTQLRGIPLALSNELGFPIRTIGTTGVQDVIEAKRAVRQIKLEGVF